MNSKLQGYLISATAVLLLLGAEIGVLSMKRLPADAPHAACIATSDEACIPAPPDVMPSPDVVVASTPTVKNEGTR